MDTEEDKKFNNLPTVTDSHITIVPHRDSGPKLPKFNFSKTYLTLIPVVIIMVGVAVSTYFIKLNQDIRSRAAIQDYAPNSELLVLRDLYNKNITSTSQSIQSTEVPSSTPQSATSSSPLAIAETTQQPQDSPDSTSVKERATILESLQSKAKERKKVLIDELRNNPNLFLSHATLASQRSTFPTDVQPFIEEEKSINGKVEVAHTDNLENKTIKYRYFLRSNSHITDLYFTNIPSSLSTGDTLQANALGFDNTMVITQVSSLSEGTAPTFYSGQRKILMMLANFQSSPNPTFTPDNVKNWLFTDANGINAFYKENSNNTLSFTGDVTNWLTLNVDSTNCDLSLWMSEAQSKAEAAGYNSNNYDILGFHFLNSVCPYAGAGSEGLFEIFSTGFPEGVYMHEIGHTTPVHHANSLDCGTKAIDSYQNCTNNEYGDPTDVMGFNKFQFNIPHKIAAGWKIPTGPITANGTYTITSNGLVIRKPDTAENYYLSSRQRTGFDSGLTVANTSGVNIHVWDGRAWTQTKMIDTTPNTNTFDDAALSDGAIFYDAINKIKITQLSHTTTTSAARVEFNAVPPTPTPTPTPSPIPTPVSLVTQTAGYSQSQGDSESETKQKRTILSADGRILYSKFYTGTVNIGGVNETINMWDSGYIQTVVANMNGLGQTAIRSFNQAKAPDGRVRQTLVSTDGTKHWVRFWNSATGWPAWGSPQAVSTLNLPGGSTKIAYYTLTESNPSNANKPKLTVVSASGTQLYYKYNTNGVWDSNWGTVVVANISGLGQSAIRSFNETIDPGGKPMQTVVSIDGRTYWLRYWANNVWGAWERHDSRDLVLPGANTTILPMP